MKKKHVLEFFRNDGWRVRFAVLVGYWFFSLALVGLCIYGSKALASPIGVFILKRISSG